MKQEELLITLGWIVNRGQSQLKMLFDLCDQDMDKLMKLEAYQKRSFKFGCPSTKEEVNKQLARWEELRVEDEKNNKK